MFYLAADVDPAWEATARAILRDVMSILGNYGPVHYFGVGSDEDAARPVIEQWCAVLGDRDCSPASRPHEWSLVTDRPGDAFTSMVIDASPPTKAIVMGLATTDVGTQVTLVHEYVHVYQMSFMLEQVADFEPLYPTWLVEGGADFFAACYAGSRGWLPFRDLMRAHMERVQSTKHVVALPQSETYADYDNAISIWGVAYMAHLSSVDIVYRDFAQDVHAKGWRTTFEEHVGVTVEEFYTRFRAFLDLPMEEQLAILPERPVEELISAPKRASISATR